MIDQRVRITSSTKAAAWGTSTVGRYFNPQHLRDIQPCPHGNNSFIMVQMVRRSLTTDANISKNLNSQVPSMEYFGDKIFEMNILAEFFQTRRLQVTDSRDLSGFDMKFFLIWIWPSNGDA
jgi:hypothetical protein